MRNEASETHIYRFGDFRLQIRERLLFEDDNEITLTPKAFDALVLLVSRAGLLVEKDEMFHELWSEEKFVEENRLPNLVSVLRKALGDNAADPKFIETVPKHGYRFIADVLSVPDQFEKNDPESTPPNLKAEAAPDELPSKRPGSEKPKLPGKFLLSAVVVAAILILVLIAIRFLHFGNTPARGDSNRIAESGGDRIVVSSPEDEAEVQRVVKESQMLENIIWYSDPGSLSEQKLDELWLPEREGGKESKEVSAAISRLLNGGHRYGKESKNLQFDFRYTKIFAPRDYAEVGTLEKWYLPLYTNAGERIVDKNPTFGPYPVDYILRKRNGRWLIDETTTPRPAKSPSP